MLLLFVNYQMYPKLLIQNITKPYKFNQLKFLLDKMFIHIHYQNFLIYKLKMLINVVDELNL